MNVFAEFSLTFVTALGSTAIIFILVLFLVDRLLIRKPATNKIVIEALDIVE